MWELLGVLVACAVGVVVTHHAGILPRILETLAAGF